MIDKTKLKLTDGQSFVYDWIKERYQSEQTGEAYAEVKSTSEILFMMREYIPGLIERDVIKVLLWQGFRHKIFGQIVGWIMYPKE